MQRLFSLFKSKPRGSGEDLSAGLCDPTTALLEEWEEKESNASTITLLEDRSDADAASDATITALPAPSTSLAWKERRQHNEQTSAFYRMPDEVLLRCFGKADFLSQQMLRQTCHRFAHIVTKLGGDRSSKPYDNTFGKQQVWPCHGTEHQRNAIRPQWAALVRRDVTDLCQGCRDFDVSGRLAQRLHELGARLWCSGCRAFHQRGKFSAPQRLQWFFKRRCIGWTGRIRVCPHLDLSWDMVLQEKKRLVQTGWNGGAEVPFFECPERCMSQDTKDSQVDNTRISDPPPQPQPKCKYPQARIKTMLPEGWHRYLVYQMGTAREYRLVDLAPDAAGDPSRQQLERAFGTMNTGDGPYLCPHMRIDNAIDKAQLLAPLQRPFCDCFPDGDDVEAGFDMQQHACTESCHWHCRCLHRTSSELRGRRSAFDFDGGDIHHTAECAICHANFTWRRVGNSIHLQKRNTFFCTYAGRRRWIRHLDPHSWHMTEDDETKHVYWCPEKGCRTNDNWRVFYRRLERQDAPEDRWYFD
ncbi:hypothetical protein SEUCBS139899_004480 [Sporothrix eucalyptigena]|uniref:F-box domain-containing protein n=1 Tax=Sporothrix eucalyptigena TaxID=1812306 RepID=A0ABP0BG91_9PEZI